MNPSFIPAVRKLYPDADFTRDVLIQDNGDGSGPFLVAWNLPGKPPTDDEIAAAMLLPLVPAVVSMRQARLALLTAGLLDQVDAAVAAADKATQITWEFATEVHRASPFIAAIGAGLGLTDAAIDKLFAAAAIL